MGDPPEAVRTPSSGEPRLPSGEGWGWFSQAPGKMHLSLGSVIL